MDPWVECRDNQQAHGPMGGIPYVSMVLPDGPIGQKALPDPPIYLIFTQCPNQLITKGKMGPWVICRVPDIGPWVNCRKINMGRHWLTSRHPYDIEIGRLVAFPNLISLLVDR